MFFIILGICVVILFVLIFVYIKRKRTQPPQVQSQAQNQSQYLGCYKDDGNNRILQNGVTYRIPVSECRNKNAKYYGLQYCGENGCECWWGDVFDETKPKANNCSQSGEGQDWTMGVFKKY